MSKEVKISVIKFEMVNGKKTYKSFTFKLNPKKMAKFKTEATIKKKVADYVAKSGIYKPSELQDLKYDMKEFLEEWKKMVPVVEAEELAKLDKSPNNPETRVTPHFVSRLAAGEIFVFGSNAMGHHDSGAAKTALEKFGAIRGQGHGLQGMSYAIDSMSGIETLKKDVDEFIEFAYNQALRELRGGRKQSHWIWYIFPQQKGLGHSHNANYYGLDGEGEARAYVEHEVLGDRLRECCKALLLHKDKDIEYIMGSGVDVMKLNTSMNLFNRVSPNDVFEEVLDTFF